MSVFICTLVGGACIVAVVVGAVAGGDVTWICGVHATADVLHRTAAQHCNPLQLHCGVKKMALQPRQYAR